MHCHQRILNESNVILTIEKALFSKCKAWFEEGKTGDWQGMLYWVRVRVRVNELSQGGGLRSWSESR